MNGIGIGTIFSHKGALLKHDPAFKITIDTTKAGSASDTFILPLYNGYTYDFLVDWGDGDSEQVTSSAIASVTHQYSSSGTYQIAITGTFPLIYFNSTGDRLKLLSIDNWGDIVWQSLDHSYKGCSNLIGNWKDNPNFSLITSGNYCFELCSSLNVPINFVFANNFKYDGLLLSTTSFNSKVTISPGTIGINRLFRGCTSFKQSLGYINIESITDMTELAFQADINEVGTTTNYDDTLVSWAAQAELYNKTGLSTNFGTSKYSDVGQAARDVLTGTYGWTITDGGHI